MGRQPNEGEFVALYGRCQGHLFRYVAALVPHLQDAEDVLGETTVVLWNHFGEFEPGTNFLAWARRIAYLRVLEYYRARNRKLNLPERLLEKLAAEAESREAVAAQKLALMAECKGELAPRDRRLLEDRYAENLSVRELALRQGRPENSISKSLGRIRRKLLECIERKLAAENRSSQPGN